MGAIVVLNLGMGLEMRLEALNGGRDAIRLSSTPEVVVEGLSAMISQYEVNL